MKRKGKKAGTEASPRPRLANYNELPQSPSSDFNFEVTQSSIIALVIVFGAACATFHGCAGLLWTYDDELAIILNRDVNTATPVTNLLTHDFWGLRMDSKESHKVSGCKCSNLVQIHVFTDLCQSSYKSFRPVTTLSFRLDHSLSGETPSGYHISNVYYHALASLLVSALGMVLAGKGSGITAHRFMVGVVAGVTFAVHPAKVEVVANVTHRSEAICAVFYLVTLLLFCRASVNSKATDWKWLLCGCMAYALAAFSKETGLTAIGCTIAVDILRNSHAHERTPLMTQCGLRAMALAATAAAVLYYRSSISGVLVTPRIPYADNPAAMQPTLLQRYLSYGVTHTRHALCLLYPTARLDYSLPLVPVVDSIVDIENVYTLLLYAVVAAASLMAVGFISCRPATATTSTASTTSATVASSAAASAPSLLFSSSVFLIVLPFAPAANILFPVGTCEHRVR
jgi:hypothetical protein